MQSHDVRLDDDYARWIAELKYRYRSAQVKAAVRVNGEKLLFNWELGRDLVQKKAEERWGSGVVEQVSLDLRKEFPDSDGFSAANLWRMKKWYLFYCEAGDKLYRVGEDLNRTKLARTVRELQIVDKQEDIKLARPVRELGKDKKLQRPIAETHHAGAGGTI